MEARSDMNDVSKLDKWYTDRWGKFTGSEIYKLLTRPKSPNDLWSAGALTYIEERALQSICGIWERPKLEEVDSLLWGNANEYPAYEMYVKATKNYSVTFMGSENPTFLDYEPMKEECGATPDAANITGENKIDLGVEIKNSINPVFHFRR